MRRCAIVGLLVFAILISASSPCQARGKGWKDVAFGALAGSALGGAMGFATLVFYSDQLDGDEVWEQHFGYGAAAGCALGTTFGAVIGWKGINGSASATRFMPPMLTVSETWTPEGKKIPMLVVQPLRLSF